MTSRTLLGLGLVAVRSLVGQEPQVDLCRLPYTTLPSPTQTAALFHLAGFEQGAVGAADSLVEVVGLDEFNHLERELPDRPRLDSATTTLYRYGTMLARLTVLAGGRVCDLTLYGPPPLRPLQVTLAVEGRW